MGASHTHDRQSIFQQSSLKHKTNHDNISITKCHYFNNNLTCPFEEMGCMFAHKMSDMCKFDIKCTRNLCSFGNTNSIEEEPNDKESDDCSQSEENDVESWESCVEMFDDIEDLIDQYGTTGHLK